LTTLTTIGYGDYTPRNDFERIFNIFIMLFGVAMFSWVMGEFNDMIINYDTQLGNVNSGPHLESWILLLKKLSKENPVEASLIENIHASINYHWKYNRNKHLSKDDEYLCSIPKFFKRKLMEFLWKDVFENFSYFFIYNERNRQSHGKFFYDVSFLFMPRK